VRRQTKLWRTREGHFIRICDMTNQHLLSAIRLLRRHAQHELQRAIWHTHEMVGRVSPGTIAEDLLDDRLTELESEECHWSSFIPDIYDSLCDDAERRGLLLQERDNVFPKMCEGKKTIHDGHGNSAPGFCPTCQKYSIVWVGRGKTQCSNCD